MFHKWESMSFNFKKTYIYILYLIYMSLNFLMHILMSRTMRQYVAYNPPHHITQYKVSIPPTCTGAELFQLWTHPRDVMCMFISDGLTILKRSPAWPTQSLKLSRVQMYRVTISPIRLKMGLCADTRCVQGASFWIVLLISNSINSCAFFFPITLISDGFLSWVTRLQLFGKFRWKISTWLFAQRFHEVWRPGEKL